MPLTWRITVDSAPSGRAIWPARVSIPLPDGSAAPSHYSVESSDGQFTAASARTLTRWPSGAPRWVQLDFQASGAGDYVVHTAPQGSAPLPPNLPVSMHQENGRVAVAVGRLKVILAPAAANPVASLGWNGRELSGDDWGFEVIDENGKAYPLAGSKTATIAVEANSPHRAQLMWETSHAGGLLDVRLRFEFLAGVEGFKLSYQFFHKQPQCAELRLRGIVARFPLALNGRIAVEQLYHSNLCLRRLVQVAHPVTIHVDGTRFGPHVVDASELHDDFEYPPFVRGIEVDTGSTVALVDDSHDGVAVCFSLRDFQYLRPKTLTATPSGFSAEIWPETAGTLCLPQGRSARQVFNFLFTDSAAIDELLSSGAANLEPTTTWLNRADSVYAGATWDQSRLLDEAAPGAGFFSYVMRTATSRWETVPEMFHYGDTPDAGYTVAYPSTGRTPGNRSDYRFAASSHIVHGLFETCHTLPPVWSNNEYDAIYCLALEALRTRDPGARQKMEAAARHQIEVDFVHFSDHWQQHRSTPQHSYDHVTLMSSIPSHQWTQGLYYYYALTGDDDVPEVIRAICDFNIDFIERDELSFSFFFNRELGWALAALVFGYELTAESRYLEMATKIIRKLERDAGRTDFSDIEKLTTTSPGLNATGIGIGFNQNTIPLGLKLYHQATGEAWALELLREWVAFGMTNFNNKATGVKMSELFPETFCYLCEVTGETLWLEESLWQLRMFMLGFNDLGWIDTSGPPLDTKHYARIYRGLSHYLGALARFGLLQPFESQFIEAKALP